MPRRRGLVGEYQADKLEGRSQLPLHALLSKDSIKLSQHWPLGMVSFLLWLRALSNSTSWHRRGQSPIVLLFQLIRVKKNMHQATVPQGICEGGGCPTHSWQSGHLLEILCSYRGPPNLPFHQLLLIITPVICEKVCLFLRRLRGRELFPLIACHRWRGSCQAPQFSPKQAVRPLSTFFFLGKLLILFTLIHL